MGRPLIHPLDDPLPGLPRLPGAPRSVELPYVATNGRAVLRANVAPRTIEANERQAVGDSRRNHCAAAIADEHGEVAPLQRLQPSEPLRPHGDGLDGRRMRVYERSNRESRRSLDRQQGPMKEEAIATEG